MPMPSISALMRFGHCAVLCACVATGAMPSPAAAQQHAGQYEQADIDYGAQLFAERCVACHGERGDLLPQANLRTGQFRNASSDRELSRLISEGLPGTAMVPTGYTSSELAGLVAYLRNMTTYDPSGVAVGDAASGKALFEGKGECGRCHRVEGAGPRYAPELTQIGATRTAAALHRTLIEPSDAMLPINRPVRAVTPEGRVVNGRRLNEDTFTVQLITEDEELVSLDKSRLRAYDVGTESAMPSYAGILTEQEIADVVAYLLSLKGSSR
jgi:putative heme-binding domain-containing protein